METLYQDLKYGIRVLGKNPGFTIVAILALALGIGANSAIFTVVNAVVLRPLSFEDPERLVTVWETSPRSSADSNNPIEVSIGDYLDFREQNQVFDGIGAFYHNNFTISGTEEPEQVQGQVTTANFFQVLGVKAALGRAFILEDEKPVNDRPVVLSHGLWQRRFGSNREIIGKTVSLGSRIYTVVGVMPQDFKLQFPTTSQIELWVPMIIKEDTQRNRKSHFLYVVAKLKQGVTISQAQSGMDVISAGLQKQYPDTNGGLGVKLVSLHDQIVGKIQPSLLVLFGAVGFVLLIACANVANLLLARATARQKEIAIRAAIGAGRLRIVRQLLTESILLGLAGGLLGLLFSLWGVDILVALSPKDIPRLKEIGVDYRVLSFTFVISILTGIFFGLVPALQATKLDLVGALKEGSSGGIDIFRRNRARSLLVISEVAMAFVILIGAGLMIKSFIKLQEVELGFDHHNLLKMDISLSQTRYAKSEQISAFYQQLLSRIEKVPGVKSASVIYPLPLSHNNMTTSFAIEGRPAVPEPERPEVSYRIISPNYFKSMRIAILKGRDFTEQDNESSGKVVIISKTAADRFWLGEDPIGKRITFSDEKSKQLIWFEIVAVTNDVKHQRLDDEPESALYLPQLQQPNNFMHLAIRTETDPMSLVGAIKNEVLAVDKEQPVSNISTMEQLLSEAASSRRFNTLLLGIFAAIALLLAATGLYGVMAYSVTQRTHEIGIRRALGAQSSDVLKMVIKEGVGLVCIGIAIGLGAAFALTRLISSLLFEVDSTDPATFAGVSLLLVFVALLASYFPARRATKVDPMMALRYE
jgi:putative ABC transport system permease protein